MNKRRGWGEWTWDWREPAGEDEIAAAVAKTLLKKKLIVKPYFF
jgi:hypothetical protein